MCNRNVHVFSFEERDNTHNIASSDNESLFSSYSVHSLCFLFDRKLRSIFLYLCIFYTNYLYIPTSHVAHLIMSCILLSSILTVAHTCISILFHFHTA